MPDGGVEGWGGKRFSSAPAVTWVGPNVMCKGPAPAVAPAGGACCAAFLNCGEPRFCTQGPPPPPPTEFCLMLQTEGFAALGGSKGVRRVGEEGRDRAGGWAEPVEGRRDSVWTAGPLSLWPRLALPQVGRHRLGEGLLHGLGLGNGPFFSFTFCFVCPRFASRFFVVCQEGKLPCAHRPLD